jgi:hypothetical protein
MNKMLLAIIVLLILSTGCAATFSSNGWEPFDAKKHYYLFAMSEPAMQCNPVMLSDKYTYCLECYNTTDQGENPKLICDRSKW